MRFLATARCSRSASALVTTLFMLSVLTVLVVGFVGSMSTESGASRAVEHTQRTKMVAQGALSHAIDLLRTNIPEPAPIDRVEAPFNLVQPELSGHQSRPFRVVANSATPARARNWVVNPGRLTLIGESGGMRHVDLHTGAIESDPGGEVTRDAETVDLNEPLPGEESPPITMALDGEGNPDYSGKRPEMRVRWVPVFKDPGKSSGEDNPLVGRYAFWIDDESAKLNFNVALGKPSKGGDANFHQMLEGGMMTPFFYRGDGATLYGSGKRRPWSLGHPRSVNLDVLFASPSQLDHNRLLAHGWLHGFSRFPEAILDFVNVSEPEEWLAGQRFNLTPYSRAPEFNPFGKSRLFTTNYPLSLEAGPLYQLPFMVNPEGDRVLHLHSLMGNFGYTHRIQDPDGGGNVHAASHVNRAQLEMLMRYMSRKWPGYGRSFIDKYGERECYQIAINMLLMARMATTTMSSAPGGHSHAYAYRSTSVNYSPSGKEMSGNNPERHYWRFMIDGEEVVMLPQTPGPHITEVRLIFEPEPAGKPGEYHINYRYEVEYYMHPFGTVVRGQDFETRVDYFKVEAKGGGKTVEQEFGITDLNDRHGSRNWNHNNSLGQLYARYKGWLAPPGTKLQDKELTHRGMATSVARALGTQRRRVPPNEKKKAVFNAGEVNVGFKIRLGMSIHSKGRPRQMIPLGETEEDVLEGEGALDLIGGEPLVFAWEIADPRLSWDKEEWKAVTVDDDDDGELGSPGERNPDEPEDDSAEKSKMKYIQWGPSGMKVNGHHFPRNDEYNSRSRTSSKGYWSVLHTGIQSREPWRTVDLRSSAEQESPPDWLLLELLGATYPMQHDNWKIDKSLPDEFSTVSFMNSTAGQVNLNSRIYPQNKWFQAPERRKPLEGVFKHLRPDAEIDQLVDGIVGHQSDSEVFDYIGELAEVDGYASGADQWRTESPLRDMAGCLTTQSNTFGVWGVAQTVQKRRSNSRYETFEKGDRVLGEKRFFAIVERYVWPGKDGMPGNAHVDSSGKWDRRSAPLGGIDTDKKITDRLFNLPGSPPLRRAGSGQRLVLNLDGSYPEYDGPQAVGMDVFTRRALGGISYRSSSLEDAYNPPQPVIKYRVVYFKYLDK